MNKKSNVWALIALFIISIQSLDIKGMDSNEPKEGPALSFWSQGLPWIGLSTFSLPFLSYNVFSMTQAKCNLHFARYQYAKAIKWTNSGMSAAAFEISAAQRRIARYAWHIKRSRLGALASGIFGLTTIGIGIWKENNKPITKKKHHPAPAIEIAAK